jgi:hypothetical protein
MAESNQKIEYVPRGIGSNFALLQPYVMAEVGNLSGEKITRLQALVSSREFERFMRPPASKNNPKGRTGREMWGWACKKLGFSEEERSFHENHVNFEWNLHDNQLVNFKMNEDGGLWFHASWY